jgi:hypothetical protein
VSVSAAVPAAVPTSVPPVPLVIMTTTTTSMMVHGDSPTAQYTR